MTNPATTAHVTTVVEHPAWCDLTQCTAIPAAARGEAHRGSPLTLTVRGIHDTLKITAHLAQWHRRCPTEAYVDFDVQRLGRQHQAAGGKTAITIAKLATIGQLVIDLAAASSGTGTSSANASPLREQKGRAHHLRQVTAVAAGGGR